MSPWEPETSGHWAWRRMDSTLLEKQHKRLEMQRFLFRVEKTNTSPTVISYKWDGVP